MTDQTTKSRGPATQPSKSAGGWAAVSAGISHLLKQQTPARGGAALLRVNQPDGFDCPGCAWPEPDKPSAFEFCENGIKAVAWETTGKRVTPDFFAKHTVSFLREQTDHWLESQGRLTHPMRYNPLSDHYEPVSWDQAFRLIGDRLKRLANPDQAVFYTSGRTSNEAAFLYQLFGRQYGTNNFPDCSNMCHESSGVALTESIGIGKGAVTLDDFEKADAIFVIGQNPGTNHPRMLTELQKASRRGARIVAINPLKERGLLAFTHPQEPLAMLSGEATPISSLYLQVTVGGDLALLKGMCKLVLEAHWNRGGVLDQAFIDHHTHGFDAFLDDLRQTSWDQIVAQAGLSRDAIAEAADIFIESDRTIICWAMGLTQHKHAAPTIQMAVNLLLMRGQIGKPGAGPCPVRGHSNVQGDRTMGITEQPKPAFLKRLGEVFHFDPPTKHGLDTVGAIQAMAGGQAKVFFAMGGNFVSASPDTEFTANALANCQLTAHVSTKLNRSHTVVGEEALILPCLGRTEEDWQTGGAQKVTVEDSMSQVHASHGTNTPASEHLLSEPAIVAGVAKATLGDGAGQGGGQGGGVDWDHLVGDYSRIRDAIARVMPDQFHNYNQRIKRPGGFYLGNSARDRQWNTATGKANFVTAAIPDLTLPVGQLRLMTLRSHDQYNTTVYSENDRYRGVEGARQVLFMNADDIQDRGYTDGDRVTIRSHFDDGEPRHVQGFTLRAWDIPRGCAAGYFPELNPLVSVNSYADRSRTPTSKFIPITIEK